MIIENSKFFPKEWENGGGPFFCTNGCGRKYKYRGGLTQHLRYECGKAPQFKCVICHKAFSRRENLKIHVGLIHHLVKL